MHLVNVFANILNTPSVHKYSFDLKAAKRTFGGLAKYGNV